ncbi:MAG: recombination protein RecR [Candidatus Solincola sediminis]|uniref:Recombination protein RecR n=1 Tax=Candidatus Solincola sediminis TaxID=1797199 RepID=A0A1F2WRJ4_9ACTN|nr:MAG: recombination protein RecR [Candidatus Solincola sediminis]
MARLVEELSKLPGVGQKTAQRLAFHLLKVPAAEAHSLAEAIVEARDRVTFCVRCFNFAQGELCEYCMDSRRDPALVCVVERPQDIVALERTGEFRGLYHVLGGAISPIDGIGPEELRIRELLERVRTEGIREVIVATNPRVEGEATGLYLANLLKPLDIKVTRIASGLPVGGDLEYADEVTLGRALKGRLDL